MTTTDRTRLRILCGAQRDIPSAVVLVLLDQLDALEIACRGYRERAERQAKLIGRVRVAVLGMVEDCANGYADTWEVRPYAHALLGLIDGTDRDEAARELFGDQTCGECRLEHPGADCQQPDLFGGEQS